MSNLYHDFFDRVVIVNLDRRKDRVQRMTKVIAECNWPFREPERFRAIDASKLKLPPYWFAGGGAYGCLRSHQRLLEDAILDGVESMLILEDDVVFRPDFGIQVTKFLEAVPSDWDQLMIGGQLMGNSTREQVAPGVMRVTNCQRTHCFAVRGQFMHELYAKWCGSYGHCDHVMGPFQSRYRVYAPDPFLAGQDEGHSDINGRSNPAKFWNAPMHDAPIFWVKCSEATMKELWRAALHLGRLRTPRGIDIGLDAIITDERAGFIHKSEMISEWISMIEWEGRSMTPETFCCLWHPDLEGQMFEEIVGPRLVQIESEDVEEIREIVMTAVRKAQAALEAV